MRIGGGPIPSCPAESLSLSAPRVGIVVLVVAHVA